jgi:Flagellar biosynthesis protein, FliO
MYDTVRWVILGILFVGLAGLWLWSRRQAANRGIPGNNLGPSFRVLQKRWVDQKTGICLVEAEEKTFLLAYTVGGSVSWQALNKTPDETAKLPEKPAERPISRRPGSEEVPKNQRSLAHAQ